MNETYCKADPEKLALADSLVYRWPDANLPWTLMDEIAGISYDDMKAAADQGLSGWKSCSGLKPVFTPSARDARLLIYSVVIDGPGNVLADCELPAPGAKQVRMRLDLSEDWIAKIKLPIVIRHEGGHAAGLGHAPAGSPNWMAPIYDPKIVVAGPWDTSEMKGRYGVAPITPTIPPAGGGGFNMSGLIQMFIKLMPIIQWLIANSGNMTGLLDLLKKIADAFGTMPKPLGLTAPAELALVDKPAFRAFLLAQIGALKAIAAVTQWTWDDMAAQFLEQAANTEWLFDLVYEILNGNILITEKMLAQAAKV